VPTIPELLSELNDATAALITNLVTNLDGLTDPEAQAPSLLPGWTRGHVLTHLARNAEGGTRLLTWARTGEPSYEYPSVAARAQAIADGAATRNRRYSLSGRIGAANSDGSLRQSTPGTSTYSSISLPSGSVM
jgi:uncharacterized protein (TIGR03083 family)